MGRKSNSKKDKKKVLGKNQFIAMIDEANFLSKKDIELSENKEFGRTSMTSNPPYPIDYFDRLLRDMKSQLINGQKKD